jgi:hypothetical protein
MGSPWLCPLHRVALLLIKEARASCCWQAAASVKQGKHQVDSNNPQALLREQLT